MFNLVAGGTFSPNVIARRFAPLVVKTILTPPWWGSRPISHTGPIPNREIRGQVQQDGVALPHVVVHLYYRKTGLLIATARSNLAGDVVFPDLMLDALGYYAVALDPEGAPLQNAIIWDRLSPTPI